MNKSEQWAQSRLERLRAEHLDRTTPVYQTGNGTVTHRGKSLINLSGNDYLGLSAHPDVVAASLASLQASGASASASRLVTGTRPEHEQFEKSLTSFFGAEGALLYGAGYMANAGVLSAVVTRHDVVIADKLVHASILDAVLLTRARLFRFEHNSVIDLAAVLRRIRKTLPATARLFVITESVFSMDGDLAPLAEIEEVAGLFDAELIVDEAHALGVLGEQGKGLCYGGALQQRPLAMIANCGKALGSFGGFAITSSIVRELLINTSRAFMYSTSLPPAVVAASNAALRLVREEPNRGTELLARAADFRKELQAMGFETGNSLSHIIPVIVGHNVAALRFSHRLATSGVLGVAIRPPTVPDGTARVRFSVSYSHDAEVLSKAVSIICDAAKAEGIL